MRAEQARDSGAKYAEQACSGGLVRFKGKSSELCEVWSGHDLRGCHVFELTGDDWQPLQTPLQRVSAASLLGYKHGVANAESDAAAKIAELEADIANAVREAKRRDPDYPFTEDTASEAVWALGESLRGTEAANKDCHDRLAELEAQVAQERQWRVEAQELADKAKLELNDLHKKHLVESAHAGDKIAGLGNANASFRATIADLTAKLAAVEDGAAFVGEEWFPVGSSVGQLSWLIYRGAAHKDDKMKLVQVRTENLAVAANRYFRYTGPKWAAPLPEPDQPARREDFNCRVYASTGVSDGSTGNIKVGVTAHCKCGLSFADDIEAACSQWLKDKQKEAGQPEPEPLDDSEPVERKWTLPTCEPEQPEPTGFDEMCEAMMGIEPEPPTKPKCLDGVPAVLCRDEEDKEWWCHGTVSNGQVLMFRWYGGKSSWTAGFVAELTPIHHAPDAAGLAEEIRGESHGKPAPVNRK